jgi:hypothetical protein
MTLLGVCELAPHHTGRVVEQTTIQLVTNLLSSLQKMLSLQQADRSKWKQEDVGGFVLGQGNRSCSAVSSCKEVRAKVVAYP